MPVIDAGRRPYLSDPKGLMRVVLALAAVCAVEGCTSTPTPARTTTMTVTRTIAAPPESPDAMFLRLVHQVPGLAKYSDSDLTTVGPLACEYFSHGWDYRRAESELMKMFPFDGTETDAVIQDGVRAYCPLYLGFLPG